MNYFQKVIIKSNIKLFRVTWTQNNEDIRIYPVNNEFILYRKFNSYKNDDIELYFETEKDTYTKSFQFSNDYTFETKIMISFNENEFHSFELYIDDEFIK
jgi:hypothetical protein